ncbi:MAG: M48 family metallopeptidase [Phycisphaeraceae bacterium]
MNADRTSQIEDRRSFYPADITYTQLIARNKRNSNVLVGVMGLLVVAVACAIGAMVSIYGTGVIRPQAVVMSIAVGLMVAVASTMFSYYAGAATILSISGAREIQKSDDPQLFNVVEELSIAGGIPMPMVYVMDSPALNAFATGRDPKNAAVAITTGLRAKLTRDELAGVIAHELSHIRHYDIRLTMLMATLAGLIVLAADMAWRIAFYGGGFGSGGGGRRRSSNSEGGGAAVVIVMVIAVLLMIVAPLLAKLIQLAVSRQREYLADAGAVELTRYPQGLADALRKLAGDDTPLETANKATGHLFIDNPFLQARGESDWDSAFSTHPPIHERIARLEALMR